MQKYIGPILEVNGGFVVGKMTKERKDSTKAGWVSLACAFLCITQWLDLGGKWLIVGSKAWYYLRMMNLEPQKQSSFCIERIQQKGLNVSHHNWLHDGIFCWSLDCCFYLSFCLIIGESMTDGKYPLWGTQGQLESLDWADGGNVQWLELLLLHPAMLAPFWHDGWCHK